jgi:hypothetical protein
MGNFSGGSAYAMSREIADGFVLLNSHSLKKFTANELNQLGFELDRVQKEIRAEQPDPNDTMVIQRRGRKLGRISQALLIINATKAAKR